MGDYMQVVVTLEGDEALHRQLEKMGKRAQDLRPVLEVAAETIVEATEENFESESWGGKPWTPWSAATAARRGKGKKLQNTGHLAGSITTSVSATEAAVGTNMVYAPIHQFGGRAGRGHKSVIPARPFMPMGSDGLAGDIEERIMEEVGEYLMG